MLHFSIYIFKTVIIIKPLVKFPLMRDDCLGSLEKLIRPGVPSFSLSTICSMFAATTPRGLHKPEIEQALEKAISKNLSLDELIKARESRNCLIRLILIWPRIISQAVSQQTDSVTGKIVMKWTKPFSPSRERERVW